MSKHKHTPGPWRWTENGRLGSVNTAESRSIAVILNSDGCMVYRDAADGWDDEQAANLALIAAAPKLLALIKEILEALIEENPVSYRRVIGEAQAAIIEAEGGDL